MQMTALQRPKRGLLGGFHNELRIGLPLLQSVSRDEAAALIAHELAHLSKGPDRRLAFVHRSRILWFGILQRTEMRKSLMAGPFRALARAYGPWFLRRSAVAGRMSELAADRMAANFTSKDSFARGVERLAIAQDFLNEYWFRVTEDLVSGAVPDIRPFREMADFLPRLTEWERAAEVLMRALAESSLDSETGPALLERLQALEVVPSMPDPVAEPAADLLGPARVSAIEDLDNEWLASIHLDWKQRLWALDPERCRLVDLDEQAAAGPLALTIALERAALACCKCGIEEARSRFADALNWHRGDGRAWLSAGLAMVDGGTDGGVECLRQALKLAPSTPWTQVHAEDWFEVGRVLLDGGEETGIDCLEQSIQIDPGRTDLAAYLVDTYFERHGSQKLFRKSSI
jgi:hypothetical protein